MIWIIVGSLVGIALIALFVYAGISVKKDSAAAKQYDIEKSIIDPDTKRFCPKRLKHHGKMIYQIFVDLSRVRSPNYELHTWIHSNIGTLIAVSSTHRIGNRDMIPIYGNGHFISLKLANIQEKDVDGLWWADAANSEEPKRIFEIDEKGNLAYLLDTKDPLFLHLDFDVEMRSTAEAIVSGGDLSGKFISDLKRATYQDTKVIKNRILPLLDLDGLPYKEHFGCSGDMVNLAERCGFRLGFVHSWGEPGLDLTMVDTATSDWPGLISNII